MSSAVARRYAHGPGVDEPLIWYEGSSTSSGQNWLIADRQGSIVATTNASGTATTYAYDPYGIPREWTGPRFRYTGQAILPELQLYHYKARVYDPNLGRFLQTDPVGYEDDLNLYAYVRNDPINFVDVTGRDIVSAYAPIVLNFAKHQGVFVGSDRSGHWEYRSLNGPDRETGRADYEHQSFDGATIQEILEMPEFSEYTHAYIMEATPEQDTAALAEGQSFEDRNPDYGLVDCNCGDYASSMIRTVDPNFPNEINSKDTGDYIQNPENDWEIVEEPPPLVPGIRPW